MNKCIHCSKCKREIHKGDIYFFTESSAANYCTECAVNSKYFKYYHKEVLDDDLLEEILDNGEIFED